MILNTIAQVAKERVAQARQAVPLDKLSDHAKAIAAAEPPESKFRLEAAIRQQKFAFICEVKKASPSKGVIAEHFAYLDIAQDYQRAGAAAISVLTEPQFFQGSDAYLTEIKQRVAVPVLRKDFTVDEYQLYEAKVMGADAVLLICALLDTETINHYLAVCDTLGLSAIVEAHTVTEVQSALSAGARMVGVNNRNLKTFEVNLNTSLRLRKLVPPEVLFIAESGIQTPEDIQKLRMAGVNAALIGETLMRRPDKKAALAALKGENS